MAREIVDAPVKRGFVDGPISVAAESGDYVGFATRRGFSEIIIIALHETAATPSEGGIRIVHCPLIRAAYHFDASLTGGAQWRQIGDNKSGNKTDYARFDGNQSTAFSVTAMATADFIYVATSDRIGGLYIDLGTAVSNNVAAMTLAHGSSAGDWTAAAITDNTKSSNTTLAVDGTMTITTKITEAAWQQSKLSANLEGVASVGTLPPAIRETPYYWVRIDTSAVLDDVDILHLLALDEDIPITSTKGTETGSGFLVQDNTEKSIDLSEWGGYVVVGMGTEANLGYVNWVKR